MEQIWVKWDMEQIWVKWDLNRDQCENKESNKIKIYNKYI